MIVPDLVKAVTDGQKKARVENQGDCFMNERLQELYLVATEQFKIVQDQGLPAPYQTRAFAEKFAELIVRESIVDFYRNYLDTTSDDDITEQVDRYVKQNFGVK